MLRPVYPLGARSRFPLAYGIVVGESDSMGDVHDRGAVGILRERARAHGPRFVHQAWRRCRRRFARSSPNGSRTLERSRGASPDRRRGGHTFGRYFLGLLGNVGELPVRPLPNRHHLVAERPPAACRRDVHGGDRPVRSRPLHTAAQEPAPSRRHGGVHRVRRVWQLVLLPTCGPPDQRRHCDRHAVPPTRDHHGVHLHRHAPASASSRTCRRDPGVRWRVPHRHGR